jgi:hypothetical protein
MKCVNCGTEAASVPQSLTARCLNCGKLLPPAPPGEQACPATVVTRHSYRTPFGKLLAQVQKAEKWVAVAYVAVPDTRKASAASLVGNLLASWRELNHPSLVRLHSFDDKELRCTWVIPKGTQVAPLASAHSPLHPAQVRALIRSLGSQLEHLHRAGLGAFDLSPSVIFLSNRPEQASFIPTPWLASQALWSPGKVKEMPFVAPELDQGDQVYPDPIRADLYALGALAWFLLTGVDHRKSRVTLPGEHSPELASWDQFIDGCCRSNPARRFDSIRAAMTALEEARPQQERLPPRAPVAEAITTVPNHESRKRQTDPAQPPPSNLKKAQTKSRRWLVAWVVGLSIAAMLTLGIYLRREQVASVLPSMGGVLVPYQRGFGDTVLQYADRSYENASWKKLKEGDALAAMADLYNSGSSAIRLRGVIGWDENSYWVTACTEWGWKALVFRCHDGHWSIQDKLATNSINKTCQRLLDPDTLLFTTGEHLYEISRRGTVDHKPSSDRAFYGAAEICPVFPDLYYFLIDRGYKNGSALKVSGGKRTLMNQDTYKEATVHRTDNTPLREYAVGKIKHTRTLAPGKAIGIHPWDDNYYHPKLVAFREGTWYEVMDLPRRRVNDAWVYAKSGTPEFLVTVGADGIVHTHPLGGEGRDLSVSVPQEMTYPKLIKVWGVSPDKFWVMDKSGTVWERKGTDWRVVVRGLYRDDVEFVDAWVSPKGNVIAVTEKHVYCLE